MIRGESNDLVPIFIFGSVGLGLMVMGYRRFRFKQWVEDLPTSRIATAAQGLIEVQGRATAFRGKVFSSHQGLSAVYLRCQIQEWRSGKNSRWETIHTSTQGEEFLVTDSSGIAHVAVRGAYMVLNCETHESTSPGLMIERTALLGFSALSFGKRYRILEEKIVEGESVTVIGDFTTAKLDPEFKGSGGFRKSPMHPFLVSDSHQEALLKKLSFGLPIMILGAALVAVSIWWFLNRR